MNTVSDNTNSAQISELPASRRSNARRDPRFGESYIRAVLRDELSLFPGFPKEIEHGRLQWQPVRHDVFCSNAPIPAPVTLSLRRIAKIEAVLDRLQSKCLSKLGRCVKTPKRWLAIRRAVVHSMQSAIAKSESPVAGLREMLPERIRKQTESLTERFPRLQSWIERVIWLHTTGAEPNVIATLNWFEDSARHLDSIAKSNLVSTKQSALTLDNLFELRADIGTEYLKTLASIANDPLFHFQRPLDDSFAEALHKRCKVAFGYQDFSIPKPKPSATVFEQFVWWLHLLRPIKRHARRQRLKLIQAMCPPDAIGSIREGIEKLRIEEDRRIHYLKNAKTLFDLQQAEKLSISRIAQDQQVLLRDLCLGAKLNLSATTQRQIQAGRNLTRLIRLICNEQPGDDRFAGSRFETWRRLLKTIPSQVSEMRSILLFRWVVFAWKGPHYRTRCAQATQILLKAILKVDSMTPACVRYFRDIHTHEYDFREYAIDQAWDAPDQLTRFVQFGAKVIEQLDPEICPPALNNFAFLLNGRPLDEVVDYVALLINRRQFRHRNVTSSVKTGFRLGSDTTTRAILTEMVDRNQFQSSSELQDCLELFDGDKTGAIHGLLTGMLLDGQHKEVQMLIGLAKLLSKTQAAFRAAPIRPYLKSLPEWFDQYPPQLHLSLKLLAQIDPNAEKTAGRVLAKNFPNKQKAIEEHDVLAKRVETLKTDPAAPANQLLRLNARLANLKSIIEEPPTTVSARRLETLSQKLRHRAQSIFINTFREHVKQTYLRLAQANDAPNADSKKRRCFCLPEKIWEPPYLEIFASLGSVQSPHDQIGTQLLIDLINRSKNRFTNHPANLGFIEKLRGLGINLQPWLNPDLKIRGTTANGEPYHVSFTDDVMDYFLMGKHFSTCLTPGNFNFFNTVAVAVDVNKRVLYGKTEDGRVIGRCQLTLNDQGELLTYHFYAHNKNDNFSEHVSKFAEQLTREMNTSWGIEGSVTTLVVDDWYDDGPINPSRNTEKTEEVSLAKWMETEQGRSGDYWSRLVDRFGSVSKLIEELPEVCSHSNWLRADQMETIIKELGHDSRVKPKLWLLLAVVAHCLNAPSLSKRALSMINTRQLQRGLDKTYCQRCRKFHDIGDFKPVLKTITELSPSIALRVWKQTRKESDTDETETDLIRRNVLIAILDKLNRIEKINRLKRAWSQMDAK
ncbi:MAG: hypothetical protein AAFN77_10865 [Planctomycetota bacterium]